MQFKPVPSAPDDLEGLAAVRDALPRVPRPERDCCADLAEHVDGIRDRDAAREWLVFLRALGLATRTSDGRFVRSDADVDRTALREHFDENVLAAREVRDALPEAERSRASTTDDEGTTVEPVVATAVRDRIVDVVPEWERRRSTDWRSEWTTRVERVLDWWVLLGEARAVDGGYVRAGSA